MSDEQIINEIVSRKKPFVLMLMPFGRESNYAQFRHVQNIVKDCLGFPCINADDIEASGYGLRDKVFTALNHAEVVIADVTSANPNVMHEVGYGMGRGKTPILIRRSDSEIPSDLAGLLTIPYGGSADTDYAFERKLRDELKSRLSDAAVFKEMLEAEERYPAYIIAKPKQLEPNTIRGHFYDYRTYGDNLGILGLISAFGLMWGEPRGVELISADFHEPKLPSRNLNLYLIGSGRVNKIVPEILARLQEGLQPQWELTDKDGVAAPPRNAPLRLYRNENGIRQKIEGSVGVRGLPGQEKRGFVEDYGIVIRAPHPAHPHRMVFILAGAHSCGTGAACLAATRSRFIRQIKELLPAGTLADKRQPFWVLVKGVLDNDEQGLLDVEGVTIEGAGVYNRLRR